MSGKPTQGLSYTSEYRAWQTMRLRCTVPANAAYPNYGGRGIKVCERWLNSVEAFIDDMGPKPSPKHELDRYPDNDGNYEPGNCRWATRSENDRNLRNNRIVEHEGEALTIAAWAERYGIRPDTLLKRINSGWLVSEALLTPTRGKAAKGYAKSPLHKCVDCPKLVIRTLCKSCENRRRANESKLARCGNAVPPPFAEALVRANLPEMCSTGEEVAA